MSVILAAAALVATQFAFAEEIEVPEEYLNLSLAEQEYLYKEITGQYCEDFADSDPLCIHVKQARLHQAELEKNKWTPPEFEKPEAYCTRFPDTCASANRLKIDPTSRFIVDSQGRTTLLHGVNAIYKVDPYIPTYEGDFDPQNSLNDKDIADLKKWGMNFMRLGVMWEGVERSEGVYDMAYLDKVEALINKMGEAGIYTLVDAHQDVFARYMCGEGIPDFYAQKIIGPNPSCINPVADIIFKDYYDSIGQCHDMNDYNYDTDDNGDFLIDQCLTVMFANYYNTKQGVTGFGGLFTNQ